MEKIDFIKQMPFWNHLSNEEIRLIESGLVHKQFSKGELILGSRESCMGMIFVEKGDVRVSIISEDGRQITLFHVEDKEFCVMTASCVIAQLTFETVISSEKDTSVWVIPSSILEKITKGNIYVKSFMFELLTQKFSSVVWVMEQILFKRFDQRLACFLLSCHQKTGSMEISKTQEEIASEVNTAREVVTRMLKSFASDGLVEIKRGKLILKDIEGLKKV